MASKFVEVLEEQSLQTLNQNREADSIDAESQSIRLQKTIGHETCQQAIDEKTVAYKNKSYG